MDVKKFLELSEGLSSKRALRQLQRGRSVILIRTFCLLIFMFSTYCLIGGSFEKILVLLLVLIYCALRQATLESRLSALEAKAINFKAHVHLCCLLSDPDSEDNNQYKDELAHETLTIGPLSVSENISMNVVKGAACLVIVLVMLRESFVL